LSYNLHKSNCILVFIPEWYIRILEEAKRCDSDKDLSDDGLEVEEEEEDHS